MKKLFRPPFLVVTAVLLIAGAGLQWTIYKFEVFLSKAPIALRRPLYMIPETFGPYKLANQEPDLTPEIEAVLGAEAYITREYRDTRLEEDAPGAIVRLHIAYWTGTPDTVIHVPEVCYIGGGAEGRNFNNTEVLIDEDRIVKAEPDKILVENSIGDIVHLPSREIPLRVFSFIGTGANDESTVAYFFTANGNFMGTTERVRALVFDVRDKYAYWCKVEVLPLGITDREQAVEAVRAFLSFALPEVMTCLPDWEDVRAGRYPPGEEQI